MTTTTTTIPTLAQILADCKHLKLTEGNKIICSLTSHEMPARADVVYKYVNGEKFKKALEWYSCDFSQYLPYIVEHNEGKNKLFCTLTKQILNRIPREVEKHVNGKRFKRYDYVVLLPTTEINISVPCLKIGLKKNWRIKRKPGNQMPMMTMLISG